MKRRKSKSLIKTDQHILLDPKRESPCDMMWRIAPELGSPHNLAEMEHETDIQQ
jgi:hypothetical protein